MLVISDVLDGEFWFTIAIFITQICGRTVICYNLRLHYYMAHAMISRNTSTNKLINVKGESYFMAGKYFKFDFFIVFFRVRF